jgi:hypothetical protein
MIATYLFPQEKLSGLQRALQKDTPRTRRGLGGDRECLPD